MDSPASVDDRLAIEKRQEQGQVLIGQAATAVHVHAEMLVLLGPVPDTERVGHPAGADQIEHADLFGQANGIPQRQHHCGEQDGEPIGACGDSRCE